MEAFHTQLTAARKAKGLTQEQLSELMNVSRPTVSRWENGHVLPDIDTIRRLNELLDYDFFNEQALPPEDAAPLETAEPPMESPAEAPKKRRAWPFWLLGGVLVCLILLSFALHGARSGEEQPAGAQSYPFLSIQAKESPVRLSRDAVFENGVGWHYDFEISETNGVPLTLTQGCLTFYHGDGMHAQKMLSENELRGIFMNSFIVRSGLVYHYQGGLPVQNVTGITIMLEGLAPDGTLMQFGGHVELNPEFAE